MKRQLSWTLLAMFGLVTWMTLLVPISSAGLTSQAAPTATPPTGTVTPPATKIAQFSGNPLVGDRGKLFSGSGVCSPCHTTMKDSTGTNVSIDAAWRATMMANAARDPYHQAGVRAEILNNPGLQTVIEDTCSKCHMPMARFSAAANGEKGTYFGDGFLNEKNPLHGLAMDGVSCTVCHQIGSAGLGQLSSFDGGYIVDKDTPSGKRIHFGRFTISETLSAMMQAVSGFVPVQGQQVTQSEICATCHTLYTPYVDAKGQVVGEFPEQMPYLEWSNSEYAKTRTCQDCHMPQAQGSVIIAQGGAPRSPFFQHSFVGGNTYMIGLLMNFGEEMGLTVSSAQLQTKTAQMNDFYQNSTATVALDTVRLDGSRLGFDVTVKNLAGHKFPTGFPSRRAWLHVTVRDANGQVVFESGAVKPDGQIVGNDNDTDAAAFEPHYIEINSGDQIQIYEAIMRDTDGKLTTTLLRAAAFAKDNRLLPTGFDATKAADAIAVRGNAAGDKNFVGGADTVHYAIDVSSAKEPFKVAAELLYQSIGYRWAQNLRSYDSPETKRFLDYSAQVPNVPARIAGAETQATSTAQPPAPMLPVAPVVTQTTQPAKTTMPIEGATLRPTVASQPTARTGCPQGCQTHLPGCDIKGNISSNGDKIYHVPGGAFYTQTVIEPSKGEKWFCTEAEAIANGWKKSGR